MYSWINNSGSSSNGTTSILTALNVIADRDVIIPDGYTVVNVVAELKTPAVMGTIPNISIGDNVPDYDNYVAEQKAVPVSIILTKNTILIDNTPTAGTTVKIHSAVWSGAYNFYFLLNKFK